MTASTSPPRFRLWRYAVPLAAIVLIILGAVVIAIAFQGPSSPSAAQLAEQRGQNWARTEIVWLQGPSLQSQAVFPLRDLPAQLRSVPRQTRDHVDVQGLDRQYGKSMQVAMVVMHGTYNTLPPGEGVNLTGDIVVLVSVRTRRVILNAG